MEPLPHAPVFGDLLLPYLSRDVAGDYPPLVVSDSLFVSLPERTPADLIFDHVFHHQYLQRGRYLPVARTASRGV
jgi:hypothetical protein